ncbi:MAG TPA: PIN domain-containing protein [Gemmatimonadales bacterium]|nr:PIN domain-containing protein [Gemmatimonadales bacterium]
MRVVPDTNVWITWSARAPEDLTLGERSDALPFLATITLQELWAGARSTAERAYCERLLVEAQRHGKLLNPPAAAWILAGQTLSLLSGRRVFGAARLRAIRNDVLLAATAWAYDAAVMTHNRADFARIAAVLPVRVVAPAS